MKALKENFKDYCYGPPNLELLETFSNPLTEFTNKTSKVTIHCHEFTSLCPVTGQPDYANIHIEYIPDKFCVESKSLKLYLMSFRNHGAFHEACIQKIGRDINWILDNPWYLKVVGYFNSRGGIAIHPEVIYDNRG